MRERRVVDRPVLLLDPDRLTAHLEDQRLTEGAQGLQRGHREAAVDEPVQVDGRAGERHGRMEGERQGLAGDRRLKDGDAVDAGGVDDDLARMEGAGGRQPGHELGKRVVRDREQHELDGADDLPDRQDRYAGKQGRCPLQRPLAHRGDTDDAVPGLTQRRAQDGADPAGTDDPDAEARGTLCGVAHPANLPCGQVAGRFPGWTRSRGGGPGSRRCTGRVASTAVPPGPLATSRRRPRVCRGGCSPRRCGDGPTGLGARASSTSGPGAGSCSVTSATRVRGTRSPVSTWSSGPRVSRRRPAGWSPPAARGCRTSSAG